MLETFDRGSAPVSDSGGDEEGWCGRAAIRVPIRRKGRKPACIDVLHPIQPVQTGHRRAHGWIWASWLLTSSRIRAASLPRIFSMSS